MLEQASDPRSVHRYVEALRGHLGDGRLRGSVAQAAQQVDGDADPEVKISAALAPVRPAGGSSGGRRGEPVPYLSRDPAVSLVQSALEDAVHERARATRRPGWWRKLLDIFNGLLHPGTFSPDDPDWVIKIGEAALGRLARGNHRFNPVPAVHPVDSSARLVVVGDWGTGLPRAQAVARFMAEEVSDALAQGRQAHVIHLGDVYYSGTPEEVRRHVLDHWPVSVEQAAAGVTSWSLNGNHDMYSGGFGYFETLLGEARFAAQRSPDGKGTSFFHLDSPVWDFVGLDTSWDSNVLSRGSVGVLQDPQAQFVESVAGTPGKKLVLFSHHQLVSVYDPEDLGEELPRKLRPVLDDGSVTAWWWGHEHRCMGFTAARGVAHPRCLGHGGVPVLQKYADGDPITAPGQWQAGGFLESDGQRWARFGFVVLDLVGDTLTARYRDDTGALVRTEVIS